MLTHKRLKQALSYDPLTGEFRWRVPLANVRAGAVAGGPSSDGYWRIGIYGARYRAHRLAWFYVHGCWPTSDLDHVNGNPLDNRIANLRVATRQLNSENQRKARSDSTTGFLSVGWHKRDQHFRAQIQVKGKHVFLGYFPTAEEAHQAYLDAKRKVHEGCTI